MSKRSDVNLTGIAVNGNAVRAHVVVDDATVTFVPDIRLHYGQTYTLTLSGVLSLTGDPLPARTMTFTTFQPVVLQHIDNVDARDVVWLNPNTFPQGAGLSPCTDMIAVAEGDGVQPDFAGGLKVYDVTDLSSPPAPVPLTYKGQTVTSVPTVGVDRALKFTAQPVTLADGSSFAGPFLMSIDGPGGANLFGAWRLWDLSQWPAITPVVTRAISLSENALADLSGASGPLAPPDPANAQLPMYRFVPNDIGIPEDLASFGTEVAYVANAPNIGLEALVPSQMQPQPLVDMQVQGILYKLAGSQQSMTVRAVSTVGEGDPSRSYVLAVEQGYGANQLLLVDPQLASADHTPRVRSSYPLPAMAASVLGLTDWPAQLRPGDPTSTTPLELALVPCIGMGLCVTAVNPTQGSFDDTLLLPGLGGVNQIRTPGKAPRGMVADQQTQLLFVADGTAGLTIIDLATPGGSRDDDRDGTDDRVLGTVDLHGARAEKVAVWRDRTGALIAGIASGSGGLYTVRVEPGGTDSANPAVDPSCFRVQLISPTQNQEFRMDMAGPTMPTVQVEAAVSPSIGALQYEFEIGSAGRGLEYEDHPSGYAYPPPLTSDWLSAPVWPITNETFGDIYGGHAKKVTLKLRDAHGEIGTWTFDRDFFVLGDILRLQLFEDYLLSKINVGGLDPSIIPAAKAVARAETGGALQQFHPIAGSIATRNGYPAVDPRHGYGIYQLTAGPPSRGQIWNWKENTDEGIKRINTLLGNVRNRFQSCNYLYTEAQLRLEAYAEYNSGWYFATSNGLNPNLSSQPPCPFVSPLAPDSSWACGVCGPLVDGQYSMRWGQSATGVCAPISQCYARVAQGFETP